MKKKALTFYYITLMAFCQVASGVSGWAAALSEPQEAAIMEKCDDIKEDLRAVQRSDARTRVYLGRYYETILTRFITPLNMRLVENNLQNKGLLDNQDGIANTRMNFTIDFIEYQKGLEELVATDCKTEPAVFYGRLEKVRMLRKVVAEDTVKLKRLVDEQVGLVTKLKEEVE